MAVMICQKSYGIQLTNVSSTERVHTPGSDENTCQWCCCCKVWKLLIRDVAVSFDSAVHRDHAGSFDAAVLSLVSAACCTCENSYF
ncbi:hypothetical protein Tco_0106243 [Tanacetum coccineum]